LPEESYQPFDELVILNKKIATLAAAKPKPAPSLRRILHYTLPESVVSILEKGYETSRDPIHGTGGLEGGPKVGKAAAGEVLYFTTDKDRWGTAEVYVGPGKGDISHTAYDYEKQKWITEENAYKKVNLEPVEAAFDPANAKMLEINSLSSAEAFLGHRAIPTLEDPDSDIGMMTFIGALVKKARSEGYDIVNVSDPGGKSWERADGLETEDGDKNWYDLLTGNSGKDDYFVLNREALGEFRRPGEPAKPAGPAKEPWQMTREEHRSSIKDPGDVASAVVTGKVGSAEPGKILKHYQVKYPELKGVTIGGLRPTKKSGPLGNHGVARIRFDDGKFLPNESQIHLTKNVTPDVVRHEIEHLLDVIHGAELDPANPSFTRFSHDDFSADYAHRSSIKKAIAEGKPVPAEVLKDYPDLAPAPAKATIREKVDKKKRATRRRSKKGSLDKINKAIKEHPDIVRAVDLREESSETLRSGRGELEELGVGGIYSKEIAGEVKHFLSGHPELKPYFVLRKPGDTGFTIEDEASSLGLDVSGLLEQMAALHKAQKRATIDDLIEEAKTFDALDPQLELLVYRRDMIRQSDDGGAVVELIQSDDIQPGDKFKIEGDEITVKQNQDDPEMLILSDDIDIDYPVDGPEIMIDEGSLVKAEEEVGEEPGEPGPRLLPDPPPPIPEHLKISGQPNLTKSLPAPAVATGLHLTYADPAFRSPDRIQADPISGEQVKPRNEMFIDLETNLGKVITSKGVRGALGTFDPGTMRTTIRYEGDMDAAAHEATHRLEFLYRIVSEWSQPRGFDKLGRPLPKRSPFDAELFSAPFSTTFKSSYRLADKRSEGVAEYMRAWMINPAAAEDAAPKFTAYFKGKVPQNIRDRMAAFGHDIRVFAGAAEIAQTVSNIDVRLEGPGLIASAMEDLAGNKTGGFPTSVIDSLNSIFHDDMAIVWKAYELAKRVRGLSIRPKSDAMLLARNFAGFDSKWWGVWMEHGPRDAITHQPIPGVGGQAWILATLDSSTSKRAESELAMGVAYMVSERAIYKSQQMDSDAEALIGAMDGLESAKEMAEDESMSPEDLEALNKTVIPQFERSIRDAKKLLRYRGRLDPEKILRWVEGRKARLTGVGGGIRSDLGIAEGAVKGMMADPELLTRIKEFARRYRAFANEVLRYARDKGRITDEQYQTILSRNSQYVSMQRVFESANPKLFNAMGGRKIAANPTILNRFTGSSRQIRHPMVNLMTSSYAILRDTDRNEALRLFHDVLDRETGMEGVPMDLSSIASRAKKGDEDTVVDYDRSGKKRYWSYQNKELFRALHSWGETETSHIVEKFIAFFPQLLRASVIHSPPFVIRNAPRDIGHRIVLSRSGSKPWGSLYYLTKKGREEFNKDFRDLQLYGGHLAGYYQQGQKNYEQQLGRSIKSISSDKFSVVTVPAMIVNAWKRFASFSETIGRVTEFRKSRDFAMDKLGYDEIDAKVWAAFQARDLADYAVMGRALRKLSKYLPFTAAGIRGMSRTIQGAQENPGRFTARWFTYIASTEAAAYFWQVWNGDDDEWQQKPHYVKDFLWGYKVGPIWLMVPKPWEMGVIASGISRGIHYARGDKYAYDDWMKSVVGAAMPVDRGALMGPLKSLGELIANYDLHKDKHIIPPWEKERELKLREGTKFASRIGQFLQSAIGMDARRWDFMIGRQFGGLGQMAMRASDIGRPDKETELAQFFMTTTGVVSRPPVVGRDARYVFGKAASKGKSSDPDVKYLRGLTKPAYEAETLTEQGKLAEIVRREAKTIREKMEGWTDEEKTPEQVQQKARRESLEKLSHTFRLGGSEKWDDAKTREKIEEQIGILIDNKAKWKSVSRSIKTRGATEEVTREEIRKRIGIAVAVWRKVRKDRRNK
jgi:hypothetical protein